MNFLDRFRKEKNPIKEIDPEELLRESIRLEREEKLKTAEVEKLAQKKKALFAQGFGATKAEQRSLARNIKTTDRDIKLKEMNLQTISNQILTVKNLQYIHEQKKLLESVGLMGKISKMSSDDLNKFLSEINLEQTIQQRGIETINTMFDDEFGLQGEVSVDDETKDLMDLWSSVPEEEVDEVYSQWEKEQKKNTGKLEYN
jgi:predicted polyphosphate/ATP-dependent NAD kinase